MEVEGIFSGNDNNGYTGSANPIFPGSIGTPISNTNAGGPGNVQGPPGSRGSAESSGPGFPDNPGGPGDSTASPGPGPAAGLQAPQHSAGSGAPSFSGEPKGPSGPTGPGRLGGSGSPGGNPGGAGNPPASGSGSGDPPAPLGPGPTTLDPDKAVTRSVSRLYLVLLLLLIIVGSTTQVLHLETGIVVTQLLLILLPAVIYLRRRNSLTREFTRLRMFAPRQLPLLVIIMVCGLVLVLGYGLVLETLFSRLGWSMPDLFPPPQTLDALLLYLLLIAVLPGVCEEFLFRGTLMPLLEKHGVLTALFFSSFLFGIFHLSAVRLPGTFILGFVIGLAVLKTGSLLAGMFMHALNNAVALTLMFFAADAPQPAEVEAVEAAGPAFYVLVPVAAVALYFSFRKLGGPPIRLRDQRFFPRGWFNAAMVISLILFLLMAALEVIVISGVMEQLVRIFLAA